MTPFDTAFCCATHQKRTYCLTVTVVAASKERSSTPFARMSPTLFPEMSDIDLAQLLH